MLLERMFVDLLIDSCRRFGMQLGMSPHVFLLFVDVFGMQLGMCGLSFVVRCSLLWSDFCRIFDIFGNALYLSQTASTLLLF